MANKTISLPEDVLPIIDDLGMPFSRWVTNQLRLHASQSTMSFADQLLLDAELAALDEPPERDPNIIGERMERSAPW